MAADFRNKVAIVTGATSGIGRATAELFAARGAAVVVAGRRVELGESVAAGIRARGGEAKFVEADVLSSASVARLMDEATLHYGRIDCAFNNAGISGPNFVDTSEHSEEAWEAVINTNLRGVWLCMKYELPCIRKGGGGAIVNSASIYAHVGSSFGIAPYVASKHGVLGLMRAAAIEFAKDRIRVNAVSPGITRSEITTPALESNPAEFHAHIRSNVPLGRVAEANEVAQAVLWLCSEEASFVTGTTLTVDGGWLAK